MTHTPAPWTNTGNEIRQAKTSMILATVYNHRPSNQSAEEAEANARLIAAAPELLAALTNLLGLVNGECPHLLDEDRGGDAGLSIAIDEAIAKAKGK